MPMLFTDGSVNIKSKTGFGAYLFLSEFGQSIDLLRKQLKVKRFENTSSTKLELQTLLWAFSDIKELESKLIVYTDSQNILSLQRRRERLEQNDYRSKNHKLIRNHELYKEFYRTTDNMDYELVKVSGHKVSNQKDDIDKIFTLVDRASRNALRADDY